MARVDGASETYLRGGGHVGNVVPLMPRRKRIALIAHDNCKAHMLESGRGSIEQDVGGP